jgi:hypothetical protein
MLHRYYKINATLALLALRFSLASPIFANEFLS